VCLGHDIRFERWNFDEDARGTAVTRTGRLATAVAIATAGFTVFFCLIYRVHRNLLLWVL
jgi:hypothetical protein